MGHESTGLRPEIKIERSRRAIMPCTHCRGAGWTWVPSLDIGAVKLRCSCVTSDVAAGRTPYISIGAVIGFIGLTLLYLN